MPLAGHSPLFRPPSTSGRSTPMAKASCSIGCPIRARRNANASVPRPKIEPAPMLRLFSVVGNMDVLAAMKGLGETHDEIGRPWAIEAACGLR